MASTPVQRATATYFKISLETLRTASRQPVVVTARFVARYLERERGHSYASVGRLYNSDHGSVKIACSHMEERLAAGDERYVEPVRAIRELVAKIEVREEQEHVQAIQTLACPLCGAPVIAEMRRQIEALQEQVAVLKNGKFERNGV